MTKTTPKAKTSNDPVTHQSSITLGTMTESVCPGCKKPYVYNDKLGNFVCCPSHIMARMQGAGIGWQLRGEEPSTEPAAEARAVEEQKIRDTQANKPAESETESKS